MKKRLSLGGNSCGEIASTVPQLTITASLEEIAGGMLLPALPLYIQPT